MSLTQLIARPKRRPRAQVRQLVTEFLSSGMPGLAFCRSRDLSRSTLYRHLKSKQRNPIPCDFRSPQLVRVELAGVRLNAVSNGGELVVVFDSGRKIEVAAEFDGSTLQRLVRVLECL